MKGGEGIIFDRMSFLDTRDVFQITSLESAGIEGIFGADEEYSP